MFHNNVTAPLEISQIVFCTISRIKSIVLFLSRYKFPIKTFNKISVSNTPCLFKSTAINLWLSFQYNQSSKESAV